MSGAYTRIQPGTHLDNTEGLSRRVSALERYLGEFEPMEMIVDTPEGGQRVITPASRIGQERVGLLHPWKVTLSDDQPTPESRVNWDVVGGTVWDAKGTSYVVNDTFASIEEGFIYLKVERESSSRAMISAVVNADTTVPESDYVLQYIPLAEIKDGEPIQLEFEEIRIHELMLVENGEFKLGTFQMAARNLYDLPS